MPHWSLQWAGSAESCSTSCDAVFSPARSMGGLAALASPRSLYRNRDRANQINPEGAIVPTALWTIQGVHSRIDPKSLPMTPRGL